MTAMPALPHHLQLRLRDGFFAIRNVRQVERLIEMLARDRRFAKAMQ